VATSRPIQSNPNFAIEAWLNRAVSQTLSEASASLSRGIRVPFQQAQSDEIFVEIVRRLAGKKR
jgi:hypothetical protein